MSQFFKDYHDAHDAACDLARSVGREVGLEKFKEFNIPGYRVFTLPGAAYRTGFELRCQIIRPNDSKSER